MLEKQQTKNFEEINKNIYRIKVPLPDNPLKELNSYLIMGPRNLLIDTGFNMDECQQALNNAFDSLGINMSETDILVTHLHGDHCGLIGKLDNKSITLYSSEADGRLIDYGTEPKYWTDLESIFIKFGYPKDDCMSTEKTHPGRKYNHETAVEFKFLKDMDKLTVGDRTFTCIITPGHSPGHLCLYDETDKILFSGDHVLGDITPNICPELGMEDSLTKYLDSLNRIKGFDVDIAYPGHRSFITNFDKKVDELVQHHEERLDEVFAILKNGGKQNAYEVAQKMTWRITCDDWEDFPRPQKWFATGEAISHLQHLHTIGKIKREKEENSFVFSV